MSVLCDQYNFQLQKQTISPEPNNPPAAGAGVVEPNKPPDAGAGVDPKSPPVEGAGAGVEPNKPPVDGAGVAPNENPPAAGAGVEPKENAMMGLMCCFSLYLKGRVFMERQAAWPRPGGCCSGGL